MIAPNCRILPVVFSPRLCTMRVLFAGTPEVALPTLRWLLDSDEHEVVGVLTRADARRGRGRTLHPSPVAALAREAGLDVRTPRTLTDPDIDTWLRGLAADVAVVVAYGRLVPAALLDVPTHGWLNLHFSRLPAWRGAAPVQRAIMAGDTVTGASIFRLEAGLDTGPIYIQSSEPIHATDTAGDLLERLAHAGVTHLEQVLHGLAAGTASAQMQDDAAATYAPMLTRDDGAICWSDTAAHIDQQVRGVTPAPGAYTTYRGTRLRLAPLTPVPDVTDLAPGVLRVSKREVVVGTGEGTLRLGLVAPAGKSWMPAEAWARGARLGEGTCLGSDAPEAPVKEAQHES